MASLLFSLINLFKKPAKQRKFDKLVGTCVTANTGVTTKLLIVLGVLLICDRWVREDLVCEQSNTLSDQFIKTHCWSSVMLFSTTLQTPNGLVVPKFVNKPKTYVPQLYKWYGFMVLIQAGLFYFPQIVWRCIAPNTLTNLLSQVKIDRIQNVEDYIKNEFTLRVGVRTFMRKFGKNQFTYTKLIFMDTLLIINAIIQFLIYGTFIELNFFDYPTAVSYSMQGGGAMPRYFPTRANCEVFEMDKRNKSIRYSLRCILPINELAEKVFLIIWAWLFIMCVLSCLSAVFKVILAFPSRRWRMFIWRISNLSAGKEATQNIETLLAAAGVQDLNMLIQLRYELTPTIYNDFLDKAVDALNDGDFDV